MNARRKSKNSVVGLRVEAAGSCAGYYGAGWCT